MPQQTPTSDQKTPDPSKGDSNNAAPPQLPKDEQDDLLEEALEETFPASDPMSSMHFTSQKPKD